MDSKVKRFILRQRPYCELPDENGRAQCIRPSAEIITLASRYSIAVCKECAAYINAEARHNVLAD